MSTGPTTIRVKVGGQNIEIEIQSADAASTGDRHGETEWEVVAQAESGGGVASTLELQPSEQGPPLHLLQRSRLSTVGEWTPERRIIRAFEWGQRDSRAALDGAFQGSRDPFPISSSVYVLLYDPSGDWYRVFKFRSKFYETVKQVGGKAPAGRDTPWRPGVVYRGFASLVEVESNLLGGSCHCPSAEC